MLAPEDLESSGQGDSVERDSAVFQQVRRTTRVCSYDRPNMRFEGADLSTPVPQPHAVRDAVADLHALLAASGESPPYVLVAHSYGGYVAEHYARRYPDEVAGLVMVDAGSQFVRSLAGCEVVTHAEWLVAQRVLATTLHTTNVVAFTGHFLQAEQPKLVVDTVREIVDAVRNAR